MSKHNIFEQKQSLKKEHEKILEQDQTSRKQKESQLISKKASFNHIKTELDSE